MLQLFNTFEKCSAKKVFTAVITSTFESNFCLKSESLRLEGKKSYRSKTGGYDVWAGSLKSNSTNSMTEMGTL